ncbi:MAG: leucyl/phenylalanyl-tRNA--protein transferase [Pseudomonadota bacterium]
MLPLLHHDTPFPPVARALAEPNGLLAVGGDLSPSRLLEAYRHGIFPWFSPGEPILWWSPDPRMVLVPHDFRVSHSLRKTLRRGAYELRVDSAFEQVMRACAAPREGANGTWIVEQMVAAYCALHRLGYTHSVEVWMEGELAGGLYGVALGRMFYGESMFSRRTDASKIALAHLSRQLAAWDFALIDCQMYTPHLASLGAHTMPRATFVATVAQAVAAPDRPSPWHFSAPAW